MLKIENVSKVFHPNTINESVALDHFSLDVHDGDFITIFGSNGAGKTTLFNAISGNFYVDEGRIILNDENITFVPDYKRAKYIGRLFQDPLKGTAPHMTIEENLALAYLRAGQSATFSRISKQDQEFFYEKLKELDMGLEDRMKVQVGSLSGGQRQALTLLMATIVPPKLLLLDEHTAALDPKAADKVMELTKKIVEENHTTCLMITHNMHQGLKTGNRSIFMADGKIVLDLSEEEKEKITLEEILAEFKTNAGKELDDDRILLSE